jgi:hypothetical protein
MIIVIHFIGICFLRQIHNLSVSDLSWHRAMFLIFDSAHATELLIRSSTPREPDGDRVQSKTLIGHLVEMDAVRTLDRVDGALARR